MMDAGLPIHDVKGIFSFAREEGASKQFPQDEDACGTGSYSAMRSGVPDVKSFKSVENDEIRLH